VFLALTFLITSDADADEVPTIIFTERGIYLSTNPDERINIGERLSLMDLGRRFSSCRVMQEYYSGDQEGIQTTIRCRPGGRFPTIGEDDSSDVSVHLDLDKTGKVFGFSTRMKGAAFTDNVQVGDPLKEAIGDTAHCNLCTEDQPPFCQKDVNSVSGYYIQYTDDCAPLNVEDRESCAGTHKVKACGLITEFWLSRGR